MEDAKKSYFNNPQTRTAVISVIVLLAVFVLGILVGKLCSCNKGYPGGGIENFRGGRQGVMMNFGANLGKGCTGANQNATNIDSQKSGVSASKLTAPTGDAQTPATGDQKPADTLTPAAKK